MNRRDFLHSISGVAAALNSPSPAGWAAEKRSAAREIMTVRGRIRGRDMGVTLTHEHALASFQTYEERMRRQEPYDRDEVVDVILPLLARIRSLGCRTFIDATAVGLGRDPLLLLRLAERSGLNILTATGNYAAADYKFLPPYVYSDSPEALAKRWVLEWTHGIEGTDVRPGFIKLGFNGGALSSAEQTLIRAAVIAHRETGMTIGAHTGPAIAAFEQLKILESARIHRLPGYGSMRRTNATRRSTREPRGSARGSPLMAYRPSQ